MHNKEILEALLDHPFLSLSQLERFLAWRGTNFERRIQALRRHGWIASVRGAQFTALPPPLYSVTPAGIKHLAAEARMTPGEFARRRRFSTAYSAALVLRRERVWGVRELMLNLFAAESWTRHALAPRPRWGMLCWDVEVKLDFNELGLMLGLAFLRRPPVVPLHGITLVHKTDSGWRLLGVEFDTGRGPIAAVSARWEQLDEASSYFPTFAPEDPESPVLMLLVAADDARLVEYLQLLRGIGRRKRLSLPNGFATTASQIPELRSNPDAPIWWDLVRLLFEDVPAQPLSGALKGYVRGNPEPYRLWQRTPRRLDHPLAITHLPSRTAAHP